MAIARGVLGRPVLPLSSVFAHSLKFASSVDSATPGLSLEFSAGTARLVHGKDWAFPRVSIGSRSFLRFSGNSLDSGIGHREDRRGSISMATSTSETVSPAAEETEYEIQEQILSHQKAAARLSRVEEARTVVQQTSLGTLSTISQKYNGFPVGSMVTYATDEDGSIILCISSLSPHTKDLERNPKCSLLVPKDPADKSDTVVTIVGEAITVADQDEPAARTAFLKKHPGAVWVDFGDFRFVRIQPRNVRYVSGIVTGLAAVGDFTGEQYLSASVDPISQFGPAIAGHMNRDHADQTAQIVENSLGVKVDTALIQDVDRYGFSVLAKRQGKPVKLRIPFPRPAEDRKAVKTLIIEMLTPKDN